MLSFKVAMKLISPDAIKLSALPENVITHDWGELIPPCLFKLITLSRQSFSFLSNKITDICWSRWADLANYLWLSITCTFLCICSTGPCFSKLIECLSYEVCLLLLKGQPYVLRVLLSLAEVSAPWCFYHWIP